MADYFQVKNQNIFNPPANTSLGNTSTQFSNVYVQNSLVVGNVSVTGSTIITPRVTTITYPGNDTAADTAGGQTITLTGSGFVAGAGILINSITVSVVSVVSSTVITFTSPANTTGSYVLYVINSDGSTAISIPGIQYSGTPAWTTTAGSLGSVYEYSPISNSTTATGDGSITYSVFSGTLPTSSSLNTSTGVITGTSPASEGATTYNFVIRATDAQLQDSDRAFSITVNIDPVTWSSPADNSTVTLSQNAASTTALSATSAAGKAITYTANTLPAGLSISGAAVTGTPTVIASTTSTFTATAATTGRTATRTINWTVSVAADPSFPYTTLLLSGAAATETFIADASVNNFPLTIVGDTKPSNFNPYTPGYYSVSFNGSSSIGTFTGPTIGTGDYTIEFWVYFNVIGTDQDFYQTYSGSTLNIFLEFDGAVNKIRHVLRNDAGTSNFDFNSTSSLVAGTWYHIAFVLNGTSAYTFINGNCTTLGATGTSSGTRSGTYTDTLMGALYSGARYLNGNMSNFRFVKGTALYTSNFTPSTIPLTAISGTALLLCQSNRFVDNSTNAFTPTQSGNLQIQSFTPFVPNTQYATQGSTYFDGNADYLSLTPTSALKLSTNSWTIEMWVNLTTVSANQVFINFGYEGSTQRSFIFYLTSANVLQFAYSTAGSNNTDTSLGASGITIGTWNHLAVVRNSTTITVYRNGVAYGTTITIGASAINYTPGAFRIGFDSANYINGYMTDCRLVNGTAVYTANFTPPTAPLTATQLANTNGNPSAAITGSATSLLTCQTNQPASNSMFLDSSTNAFAVTRAGNTSAGTFTPYGANWSNYFNGSSYMVPATGINAAMGTGFAGNIISFEMWIFPTTFTNGGDGNGIMGAYGAVAANGRWLVSMERSATTTAKLQMAYTIGTGSQVNIESTASAITLNQWNHIAITVDATTAASSTIKLFANGVLLNTFTGQNMSTQTAYYRAVYIGDVQSQYVSAMVGYISNFRILKGAFAYTGNYTVPTAPLTAIANTVLLTCQSNSSVDNSANAFALSLAGPPTVQRFSPFGPQTQTAITHSAYFDGNGDSLTAPNNAAFAFGTGDFTIETWVYSLDITGSSQRCIIDTRSSSGSGAGLFLRENASTNGFVLGIASSAIFTTSSGRIPNVWQHLALVRISGTVYFYINGVLSTSTAFSTNLTDTLNRISGFVDSIVSPNAYYGYISNLRIVKGVAVYTAAFTVPTAPLTATQAAGTYITAVTGTQTSLLTCQSPTFVDNSTNAFAITAFGEAKPRTLNPFGFTNASAAYSAATYGGSAYFDGTTDYLATPSNAAFGFGTGDFTIECWIYPTGGGSRLLEFSSNTDNVDYSTSTGTIGYYNGSASVNSAGGLINANTWAHIAIVRLTGTVRVYVNGVLAVTQASTPNSSTRTLYIGGVTNGFYTGYISNARVVKGVAVYTSNFVPPTAPLTAITNTSLLLNMASAGVYDSASTNNLETVADAKRVATHTPYAGSYYSNYFDGTGDVFTVSNNSGFNFSSDFIIEAWLYPTAFGQGGCNFMTHWSGGSNVYVVRVLNNARVQFLYTAGGTTLTGTSTTVSLNQWSHVAVCRSGSTLRIFVNGIADTTTATYSGTLTGGGIIAVGAHNDTSEGWTGYISNLRVVNTPSAPYTTTFTPSTTPLTSITGTALLTCQSNRFLDNSANAGTITKSGHVAVQSFNPFQRNSAATMYFDGNGDYLTVPATAQFAFGIGNFTIEAWIYLTAYGSSVAGAQLFGTVNGATSGYSINVGENIDRFRIVSNATGSWADNLVVSVGGGPPLNAWTHMCVVRSGANLTIYKNGVSVATTASAATWNFSGTTGVIGRFSEGTTLKDFPGYINDLRVTKGVARYTGTFTPSTSAFITK